MSYESPVPPVPSRHEEVEMNEKIKKSFRNQTKKWVDFESPDSQRLIRMKMNRLKKEYKHQWWRNWVRGLIASVPLAIAAATLMSKRKYNVPQYYHSVWYPRANMGKGWGFIKFKQFKVTFPLVVATSYFYATAVTDHTDIEDYYFEKNYYNIMPEDKY